MRLSRLAAALAVCAGAAAPVTSMPAACAGEGARAALVVDRGAAATTYCVALPDDSVTGIELVQLAGEQHGLDYSLGFGGEAVCRLEGVGPEGDDCFGEYPEFWGYWHGNGSGGWTWAGSGAGSASVEDGDVDGWSWGTGDNGSNHQAPPATGHEDVCVPVAPPPKEAKPDESRPASRGGSSERPDAAPAAAPALATAEPDARRRPQAKEERRKPRLRSTRRRPGDVRDEMARPSPAPAGLATRPVSDEGEGPPLTGLVGLVAAAGLGAAVWTGSRRRSRD
jgi:hypothetical protein